MKKEEKTKLLCPYCNFEFDTEMESEFEFTGSYCDTCCYNEYTGAIDIKCKNCHKTIYRKEGIVIY